MKDVSISAVDDSPHQRLCMAAGLVGEPPVSHLFPPLHSAHWLLPPLTPLVLNHQSLRCTHSSWVLRTGSWLLPELVPSVTMIHSVLTIILTSGRALTIKAPAPTQLFFCTIIAHPQSLQIRSTSQYEKSIFNLLIAGGDSVGEVVDHRPQKDDCVLCVKHRGGWSSSGGGN